MDFKKLLAAGLELAHELSAAPIADDAKLGKLAKLNEDILEQVDDLVSFLPGGFGVFAKLAVDNPLVDNMQREVIYKPLAEAEYQIYNALHRVGGDAAVKAAIAEYGGAA